MIFEVTKVLEGHPEGRGKGPFSHSSAMLSLALDHSRSRGLPPDGVVMQLRQHHVGMREGERCEQTPADWPLVLPQPVSPESRDPLWSENSESLLGPVPQQSSPGSNHLTWGQSGPRPALILGLGTGASAQSQPVWWALCCLRRGLSLLFVPQCCPSSQCCPESLVPLLL